MSHLKVELIANKGDFYVMGQALKDDEIQELIDKSNADPIAPRLDQLDVWICCKCEPKDKKKDKIPRMITNRCPTCGHTECEDCFVRRKSNASDETLSRNKVVSPKPVDADNSNKMAVGTKATVLRKYISAQRFFLRSVLMSAVVLWVKTLFTSRGSHDSRPVHTSLSG